MWNRFHRCWLALLWFSLNINCPQWIKTWGVFCSYHLKVDPADCVLWAGKFWPNKPGWDSFDAASIIYKWFSVRTLLFHWGNVLVCHFWLYFSDKWRISEAFWLHLKYLADSWQFISGQPPQWSLWPSSLYPIVLCIEGICMIRTLSLLLPQWSSSLPIFLFTAWSLFWEPCFQFLEGICLLGL